MRQNWDPEAGQVYQHSLDQFKGLAGHWVLIRGGQLVGVFPSRDLAEATWMLLYGPTPMYLRQVTEAEAGGDAEA